MNIQFISPNNAEKEGIQYENKKNKNYQNMNYKLKNIIYSNNKNI